MANKIKKCNIKSFVEKYENKMKGGTYSSAKGWVGGIKECSKSRRKKILRRIRNKYFDYPGATLK